MDKSTTKLEIHCSVSSSDWWEFQTVSQLYWAVRLTVDQYQYDILSVDTYRYSYRTVNWFLDNFLASKDVGGIYNMIFEDEKFCSV